MIPCCYDWDATQSLGNAFEGDFAGKWHGEVYAEFRRRVLHEKSSLALCHECQGADVTSYFGDTYLLNGSGASARNGRTAG